MRDTNAADEPRAAHPDSPQDRAADSADGVTELADPLIEDVSIDGMCGVY
ncbi:mycofactocin precursor MftA [Streptomyces griseoruber]|nr:mycofactocin precursor MftA [Streptomyces griseoruber]